MQQELRQDIERLDHFEFLVLDDSGTLKAMMIIDSGNNPHYGKYFYPRYSISTEKGLLIDGYKWLKELTKIFDYDGYFITRQIGE